jgi:hypothetical protein
MVLWDWTLPPWPPSFDIATESLLVDAAAMNFVRSAHIRP